MFCYQCEQTVKGVACVKKGVCGKDPETAVLQDLLLHVTEAISQYAHRARALGAKDPELDAFVLEALFTTVTNVNFDADDICNWIKRAAALKDTAKALYKKACADAKPVLLEPIMKVTITAPDEYMGDIMGDLNGRRGRVLGMDSAGKNQIINAEVPMAEFLTYAPDLRSMTGGRGMFTMAFSHYDEVPAQLAEKVIEEIKAAQE